MTKEPIVKLIPLALIDPPLWDSRVSLTGAAAKEETVEIGRLAESIARDGQKSPIVVIETGDRYRREDGGRRILAVESLSRTEILAAVHESADEVTSVTGNIVANTQRKALTSYEFARAAMKLRELKVPGREAAKILNTSVSRLSDYGGMMQRLPAPILKDWENNHPAVDIHALQAIARSEQTDEQKIGDWEGHKALFTSAQSAGGDEEDAPKKKRKSAGPKSERVPLSQARYREVLATARAKKTPEKVGGACSKKWLVHLLEYLATKKDDAPAGIETTEDDSE